MIAASLGVTMPTAPSKTSGKNIDDKDNINSPEMFTPIQMEKEAFRASMDFIEQESNY